MNAALIKIESIAFHMFARLFQIMSDETQILLEHCHLTTFITLFVNSDIKPTILNLKISNSYFHNFNQVYKCIWERTGSRVDIRDSTFVGSVNESESKFYSLNYTSPLRQLAIICEYCKNEYTISSSFFSNLSVAIYVKSQVRMFGTMTGTISIIKCSFVSNYFRSWNRVQRYWTFLSPVRIQSIDITYIYNSSFIGNMGVEGGALRFGDGGKLHINNSMFIRNIAIRGGALTSRAKKYTTIVDTKFINNSAAFECGAICSDNLYSTEIFITRCQFVTNFIDKSIETMLPRPDIFQLLYSESYEVFGIGGAIMFSKGSAFHLLDSIFIGNNAPSLGGAIYYKSPRRGLHTSEISNCIFNGSSINASFIGTVIYSNMRITFNEVTVNVQPSNNIVSVFYYETYSPSIIESLRINCPTNSKLFHYEVSKMSSYSGLYYFCAPCARWTYSLNYEYDFIHHYENITKNTIHCHPCPTGGICENGLVSNDNYWGYKNDNDEVTFTPCPALYCCSTYGQKCTSYYTCERDRKGMLCGECISGYAENILSINCVANKHCGGIIFCVSLIFGTLIYTVLIIYFDELTKPFKVLSKSIFNQFQMLRETEIEDSYGMHVNQRTVTTEDNGMGSGLLKIIIFFYQVEFLLQVKSSMKKHYKISWLLTDVVTSIFNFKPSVKHTSFYLCAWANMDAVGKEIVKLFAIISTLIFLFITCFLSHCCIRIIINWKKSKQNNLYLSETEPLIDNVDVNPMSVSHEVNAVALRLKCAILRLILLTYMPITTVVLKLINCVPIGNSKYLFINGNIKCFAWWQYLTICLLMIWIAPFCICLYILADLLRSSKIGPGQFLTALLFPPLTFYYVLKAKCCQNEYWHGNVDKTTDIERRSLLQVFSGQFKRKFDKWIGMVFLRKFCLSLASVYIINPVLRLYVFLFLLIGFQLIHIRVQPYKSDVLNWLESISLALLIIFTGINLFWAHSFISDITQMSVLHEVGEVFLYIELIVLSSPIIILILLLLCAFGLYIYQMIKRCFSKQDVKTS